MDELYQEAVDGRLRSHMTSTSLTEVVIENRLQIPLAIATVTETGRHKQIGHVAGATKSGPYPTFPIKRIQSGVYVVVSSRLSGGFVTVLLFTASGQTLIVNPDVLTAPNRIGLVPQPTKAMLLPPNTPRIVVGTGALPNGNVVIREQLWQRRSDSISLAPGEKQTVSFTLTSGTQRTSSSLTSVETSLTTSASAGMGWIGASASISASLSAHASFFQQVNVTEEQSSYHSKEFDNTAGPAVLNLFWQLTDIVTILDPTTGKAASSIVMAEQPPIVTSLSMAELADTLPPAYDIAVDSWSGIGDPPQWSSVPGEDGSSA